MIRRLYSSFGIYIRLLVFLLWKKSFCNKKAVIVALTALASGFGPIVSFVQIDPKDPQKKL